MSVSDARASSSRPIYPDPEMIRAGLSGPHGEVLRVIAGGEGVLPNQRPMHPLRPPIERPAGAPRPDRGKRAALRKHVTPFPAGPVPEWTEAQLQKSVAMIAAGEL